MTKETLLKYYELFDPIEWYENEGIENFEDFIIWFNNMTYEEHLYNLIHIAGDRQ